jgi:hypothetical protein
LSSCNIVRRIELTQSGNLDFFVGVKEGGKEIPTLHLIEDGIFPIPALATLSLGESEARGRGWG